MRILAPKDWPIARTLLGKISAMNTQMTAPCPTACDAIKSRRKVVSCPLGLRLYKKPQATIVRLII